MAAQTARPGITSRLFARITARIALATLLFLVLPGLIMTQLAIATMEERAAEERRRLTLLLAQMCAFPLAIEDYATLSTITQSFAESPEVLTARVHNTEGAVLLKESLPENQADGVASSTKTSHPILARDGTVLGYVFLEFNTTAIGEQTDIIRFQLWGLGLGAALLIIIVLSFSLRWLVGRPITALLNTMRRIESGELDVQAPVYSNDEIGQLAKQSNAMTSRLRQSMEHLANANEDLKDLDRMKSFFLATVSHELRTPLTSIIGYAKLVERDVTRHLEPAAQDEVILVKCSRIRENLKIINLEGQRLARLVNDVLDLTRIESGKMDWRDSLVSPAKLLEDAQRAVSGQFAMKRNVLLQTEAEENLPLLYVDPDRIQQVLVNLLHNAAKFTERGHVTLSVTKQEESLKFQVADSGPGIAQDELESIFGMFQQATDTKLTKHRGAGLGLAISSLIISHYKGRLWVESNLGQGSTFSFTIPLQEEHAPHAQDIPVHDATLAPEQSP